eukprot:147362-Rhodomonas_salina.2
MSRYRHFIMRTRRQQYINGCMTHAAIHRRKHACCRLWVRLPFMGAPPLYADSAAIVGCIRLYGARGGQLRSRAPKSTATRLLNPPKSTHTP